MKKIYQAPMLSVTEFDCNSEVLFTVSSVGSLESITRKNGNTFNLSSLNS